MNTSHEESPQLVTPKKNNPKGKVSENCFLNLFSLVFMIVGKKSPE